MQIYQVGGSVRDELLGGPVRDRDWVVVGATPEDMRALGYRPVGKDFPVFLHPQTHEEYALARTERKTAPGYHGFAFHASPDVTLEEDLRRRDLTINAIAKDASGAYIDPFGGRADLAAKVFRHVSDAFAEDPVRILRVARFAARFTAFTVAPETRALMRRMVEAGEVDALVPERVWQELARGLMEPQPSRMFETLRACAALAVLLPEVGAPPFDAPPFDAPAVDARLDDARIDGTSRPTDRWTRRMRAVDRSAALGHPLPVRFAVLLADTDVATADAGVAQAMAAVAAAAPAGASSGSAPTAQRCVERVKAVCARLRVPADERDLALIVAREQHWLAHVDAMPAEAIVDVLERCDALRRPSRFVHALDVCDAIAPHGADVVARAFAGRGAWLRACEAARGIDAGRIAADLADRPQAIRDAVRQARIAAVAAASGTH